jgi:hypothetical protein
MPKPIFIRGKQRLSYKNNWESDEYYAGGQLIESLREVSIDSKLYKVKPEIVSIPYNDMGHDYEGVSTHYFIEEEAFGITMKFDLNKIVRRAPVFATYYTVKAE